jgi:hypothetical protein
MKYSHLAIRSKKLHEVPSVIAHNLYSVNDPHRHYIWGSVEQEETLGERVAAAAAFLACIALLIIITG